MYDFQYNTWMKKYPKSTLLFTDTDSLAYEVAGHDLYAGMPEIKDEFDFSEYPGDHFLQSYENMKVVGKFKDECKRLLVLRFVGLRPKLYSFDYDLGASYHLTLRFLFLQRGIPQQNDLVLYFLIHLSTLFFQLVY